MPGWDNVVEEHFSLYSYIHPSYLAIHAVSVYHQSQIVGQIEVIQEVVLAEISYLNDLEMKKKRVEQTQFSQEKIKFRKREIAIISYICYMISHRLIDCDY